MITMLDSIDASILPAGDYAYAGYVNGRWQTYTSLKWRFPTSDILSITVTASANADCLDVETGDATTSQALSWVKRRLAAGAFRPCLYASVSTMQSFLPELTDTVGDLSRIRLWTAHYQAQHMCGPHSCGQLAVEADGTQWTDQWEQKNIDASECQDDFFRSAPKPTPPDPIPGWETDLMNSLPTLQQGSKDQPGSVAFVHRCQALTRVIGQINDLNLAAGLSTDGDFGPATKSGVEQVQKFFKLTADGVVGPKTWAVLVSGAP